MPCLQSLDHDRETYVDEANHREFEVGFCSDLELARKAIKPLPPNEPPASLGALLRGFFGFYGGVLREGEER